MTPKQAKDLETVRFFIPDVMKHLEISEQDISDFFEYSEQGKRADRVGLATMDGFNALCQGKRWRGIHIEMWEQGVSSSWVDPKTKEEHFESDVPYAVLLESIPESVMEFAAKTMFKGADQDLIHRTWYELSK